MKIRLTLFSLIAIAQLAVPAQMIWQQEQTLKLGREFKFETAPVDPVDAFRGRYVALSFKDASVQNPNATYICNIPNGATVYVTLGVDANGFAKPLTASLASVKGDNVIRARVGWQDGDKLNLVFPFNRFYLEEKNAPRAEEIYRKTNREAKPNAPHNTYVTVRVYHDSAALEDLYIDGKPIREILANREKPRAH